jgi:hypothetical protein
MAVEENPMRMETALMLSILLSWIPKAGAAEVDQLVKTVSLQQAAIQTLSKQISECAKKTDIPVVPPPAWPSGSYCIFKSGTCPEGFSVQGMALQGIKMWESAKNSGASESYYVSGSYVGDSVATWENRPIDNALMRIQACCK